MQKIQKGFWLGIPRCSTYFYTWMQSKILEVFLVVYSIYFFWWWGDADWVNWDAEMTWIHSEMVNLIFSVHTLSNRGYSTKYQHFIWPSWQTSWVRAMTVDCFPLEKVFFGVHQSCRRLAICHTNSLSDTLRRLAFLLPAKYAFSGKKKGFSTYISYF